MNFSKLRRGFILASEAGVRASVQCISPPTVWFARQIGLGGTSPSVVRPAVITYWTSDDPISR